ncbi:MAG: LD-carboxypeptidase [Bacteroidales bacterium]|nr:LD-carboxypeptidase [Bacteroidales bacterium]
MNLLIRPPYLKKGDAIAIVAPARSIQEKDVSVFADRLESEGFQVVFGKYLFGEINQMSGTLNERLSDIHQMIEDPRIKAVFAARGGYGTSHLLSNLDAELFRKNPKWIVGFSDVTVLHAFAGKIMETMHGIMPYSFVMEQPQDDQSFRHLLDALTGQPLDYRIPDHPLNLHGKVNAQLTGGNLSVLYSMAGTDYEPDYEGKILFLEDVDEYLYHIDRMVMNFELRNVFEKAAGLIVGDFSDMHDNAHPFGHNALEIIAERARKHNLPAMFGFPAGHKKSNFPLIFGRVSTLTIERGNNSLVMYQ